MIKFLTQVLVNEVSLMEFFNTQYTQNTLDPFDNNSLTFVHRIATLDKLFVGIEVYFLVR